MAHGNSSYQSPTDVAIFWIFRVVVPVVALGVILAIAFLIYTCCRKRKTEHKSEGDYPLERFAPSRSSSRYEKISLASSSGSSTSEGYGSLHSHSLLLGRHASSVHELTPVDDANYLDISDVETSPGDLGQVLVSLSYSKSKGLTMTILEATNLLLRPFSESIDPYVRIRVKSNDKDHFQDFQFQSSVKRKTQNPIFEETFVVNLSPVELRRYVIQLVVVNYHKYSRKDVIGEICIPLHDVTTTYEITKAYDLQAPQKKLCGEILLSLSYLPTSNRLLLGILRASNLTCPDDSRNIDPCVQASLIMGGRKYRKKKTGVVTADVNPVFNDKFFFEIPAEKLERIQILVAVTNERESGRQDSDTDPSYSDAEVGQVILAYRSTPRAHAHWMKMMSNPREKYCQWYDLTV
ncbi:synaptotagmin-7 [Strongylocentrotus purpuratus]|uniref:C2 domain-containing protein n=1 Tax=Strongylocentrotus purpuratus TaxID=7668 RepID=A0A7M7G1I5_STRPU|nr:synaptotagmin-7 [Strongylocentrotus purpuratus]|eukprot:XP_001201280.2 PREDICTED: synaptotagmin-7 [Strongylocentrotus purpuratus]